MEMREIEPELLKLIEHSKKLKVGMDIFRNIEFPVTVKLLSPKKDEKILDVGCGQSILPSYIAKQYQSTIIATDAIDVENIQKNFFKSSNLLGIGSNNRFSFKIEDATKLSFPDETFDSVYAVSSIEHIPDNGDSDAVQEMLRVTKPHGIVVITVPFSYEYIEQKTADHYHGFERRYDFENLKNRLLKNSKPSDIKSYFLNNKYPWLDEFCHLWYQEKLYEAVTEFSWKFTKSLFSISTESNQSSRGAMIRIIKN